MIQEIADIEDVSQFFNDLFDEGVNAHPDEDFTQYINAETGEDTFSPQEAELRNTLMSQSFEVCEAAGSDIYDLMQEAYLKRSGLDRSIPLPSES